MKIIRAEHLGMCFGVKDAIALAKDTAARVPSPLTILGDLAHNPSVLEDLREHGIQFSPLHGEVPNTTVMITAHGTSDRIRNQLAERAPAVIDGTCPLVHQAHRALLELVQTGHYPVVIGMANHVEVRGLTGDLDEFSVVLAEQDLEAVPLRDKYGVVAQTTQPIQRVIGWVEALKRRFPHSLVSFRDTVCRPTKQRQTAAVDLALRCEVVVVIGGLHSNNTRELAAACEKSGARTLRIQGVSELRSEWFENVETVGITAGTSTPDEDIDAVEAWLVSLAANAARDSSRAERMAMA